MTDWDIPLSDIHFDESEIDAVTKVLKSGWLTMGTSTKNFEDQFAAWILAPHAIAVSSGTAALHLACLALDIGPGDEVILPALTFVATANAVRYTGATPIFADIQSENDLTISPDDIRSKITQHTKAIIVMHYAGYPCDMANILKIGTEFDLPIIEDAAHAVGSRIDNYFMGTMGKIGCFSFFSNKNLITGEGGMIVTNNSMIAERVSRLRSHGMTTLTWDRHKGHASSYDVVDLGYNYRLDEIRAALGITQLKKLNKNNKTRRYLTQYYLEGLREKCPTIGVPFTTHRGIASAHIMPVLIPKAKSRNAVMEYLKRNKIQTSIHYPPIYQFENYRSYQQPEVSLPITEDAASRELTLPLYPDLTTDQIDQVIECLNKALH